jgi:hypothetical protein
MSAIIIILKNAYAKRKPKPEQKEEISILSGRIKVSSRKEIESRLSAADVHL